MIDFLDSKFWGFRFEALYEWTMILPVVAGLFAFSRHTSIQRKLFFYCVAAIIFEYFSQMRWAIDQFEPRSNAPYYHFFTPALFILFVFIYQKFLRDTFSRRVDIWLIALFVLFSIWNAGFGDGLFHFPGLSLGLYAFLMMSLAIGYFLRLMTTLELERLEKEPVFWINSGVLIYFSGNFLLWLTMNYLLKDYSLSFSIYKISVILGFCLNIFFTIAFVCHPKVVLPIPVSKKTPHGNE
ncbi:hypothetical protein [Neolewinella agarilytica]|uniref:hypothetical protein n=1 Tax=Neolewinella agarilytica TaxID=478744 RepID=UPI0023557C13|nr:hypothetical protein [Neolewinella agarilytica]